MMNQNNSSNPLNLLQGNYLGQLLSLIRTQNNPLSLGLLGLTDPMSLLHSDGLGFLDSNMMNTLLLKIRQQEILNSNPGLQNILAQNPQLLFNTFHNSPSLFLPQINQGNLQIGLQQQQLLQNFLNLQNQPLLMQLQSQQVNQANNLQQAFNQQQKTKSRPQKCFNNYCTYKGDKLNKVKSVSKNNPEYIYFCDKCYKLYQKNNYCDFCEQVFSNKKTEQDDKEWIQCDICSKWNHISCEAERGNANILKEKDACYYCVSCRGEHQAIRKKPTPKETIQHSQDSPDSDPFVYEITTKQNRRYFSRSEDFEDFKFPESKKERNLSLIVSKDNKVQLNIRINLLEEEIRKDLEDLRGLNKHLIGDQLTKKKKVKRALDLSPPQRQAVSPQEGNFSKEQFELSIIQQINNNTNQKPKPQQTAQQTISRPRRNVKVNYRSMVGE